MRLRRRRYDAAAPAAGTPAAADAPARRGAYDMTRALFTLVGAGAAGFLIWLASLVGPPGSHTDARWWAAMGLVAGAGLAMALSQLFGGWTKWGVPRLSAPVFVFGFLPVLVCVGWILITTQPHGGWEQHRLASWSSSIGIAALVRHIGLYGPALAFGFGLTFGFSFDTTGPLRRRGVVGTPVTAAAAPPHDRRAADEPVAKERAVAEPGTPTTKPRGRLRGRVTTRS